MRLRCDHWLGVNIILAVLVLLTGFLLVWLNIERIDLAYELKKIRSRLESSEDLRAKLEVERNNLVAPYRLKKIAEQAGLNPAAPGQVLILEDTEAEK